MTNLMKRKQTWKPLNVVTWHEYMEAWHVPNSSLYNLEISFYSFPVESVVRTHWLINIHKDNFSPTKNIRVHSSHFSQESLLWLPDDWGNWKRELYHFCFHGMTTKYPQWMFGSSDHFNGTECRLWGRDGKSRAWSRLLGDTKNSIDGKGDG